MHHPRAVTYVLLLLLFLVPGTVLAQATYTVQPGDSLRRIAEQHGVSVDELREWNELDGDLIRAGDVLAVRASAARRSQPTEIAYQVRPGDILGSIAEAHGVSVAQLRAWNNLRDDIIRPGQTLTIRTGGSDGPDRGSTGTPGVIRYEVQPGDILGGIAERHQVTVAQIREWNRLSNDTIRPGQVLTIRPGSRPGPSVSAAGPTGGFSSSGWRTHRVSSGETLIGIAQRYGVTVDQIRTWNPSVRPERLQVGQQLRIGSARGRMVRRIVYEVQPGDFLGRIAERHGVRISDITRWNNNMNPDSLRIGQRLVLLVEGPEEPSESVGRANEGRLVNGEQLPPHRGWRIRDTRRAWGTNETITYMLDGFDHVLSRFPNSPRLMVHDLSYRNGGPIGRHRSHQSGRDADIGYYIRNCGEVCEYRNVRRGELDAERQWALMHFWMEQGMVDYMFVDYTLQRELYEWLQRRGASAADLNRWFQYPHGRNAARGIIRHEPGHLNHIHVRFSCSRDDDSCR